MPKPFTAFIIAILISGLMQNAAAGKTIPVPDSTAPRTFAVIMGISTYKYIRPLAFADSDADLFKDFLKSPGGGNVPDSNIYFQKNETATAASFIVKGVKWLNQRSFKPGDRLFIYLAGHGDAIDAEQYFFLAYDCNPAGDKQNYILSGGIQLFNIKVTIEKLSRKGVEVIFIMDACRSNELPGGGEGQEFLNAAISERKAGEMIMLATGAGQESLEDPTIGTGHGLFTYYLVDGLAGMADGMLSKNNEVSMEELKLYIQKTVPDIAKNKFNRKQDPYLCCEEHNKKIIAKVDTGYFRKWELAKKLSGYTQNTDVNTIGRGLRTRGIYDVSDTTILQLYNNFTKALKELNLSGNEQSAEAYLQQLNSLAPNSSYTQDAKVNLATEFINFAQSKINLYLDGRDVATIQRIRSQLDADDKSEEITNSLDRMEKVARQESSEVGKMLDKAIVYAELEDDSYLRSLQAKSFFFKANGYFENSKNSNIALKQAIGDAMAAHKADPKAAYILNILASLQLDNRKPDSAVYFGKKAIAAAPGWRYPYVNVANAFSNMNKSDSALVYFKKALAVDDSRADAYVDLGYFYFQQRKLDSAKAYYQKALVLDPSNVPANNNMGWLLREQRKFDQSLVYFRKTLSLDSSFFNAYNGISRVFTDMRMFDSAKTYYQKALKNYPDKLIATNYIGQFYQDINQVDSARAYYTQAAVYDPSYDAPYINLGRLYAQVKKYDSAKFYYNKAIELNNKNFRGFNQLGLLYADMKNFDSAFYYYGKGLDLNPGNTIVLNNLGLAYYGLDKFDSAARYFRQVINVNPGNVYAINNLGLVFYKMKKADSAMAYYSRALDLKSDLESALNNMGVILREKKDFDGAKHFFKRIVEAHPENTQALSNLEVVFKQNNEFDSAIYYYVRSIEKGVRGTPVFNKLGSLFFENEKFDSAARWYNRAVEFDPQNAVSYYNLAAVFNSLQHYDSAVAMYKKALELDPKYFNACLNLGVVYHNMKLYDSAAVYTQKATQIDPRSNLAYYYLALNYAQTNRHEDALNSLRQALEKGYNRYEYIIAEPDLFPLRKYPAYKAMMKKHFPNKYKELDDQ
jgi:tetratricopeptide (TPR) repeat protein